jgi:hypothetical protein
LAFKIHKKFPVCVEKDSSGCGREKLVGVAGFEPTTPTTPR